MVNHTRDFNALLIYWKNYLCLYWFPFVDISFYILYIFIIFFLFSTFKGLILFFCWVMHASKSLPSCTNDSMHLHGPQAARLLCPWNSPGIHSRNTGIQEYWSGLPCPPPEDLPNPGIKCVSLMSNLQWQVGSLPLGPLGSSCWIIEMGNLGNSLIWSLGLCILIVGDTGLILCQGTKILRKNKEKKRKKAPRSRLRIQERISLVPPKD